MRNENYYVVHGWMINELGLSGVELDIYAIIYGFTQDGVTEFKGSIKYLEEWTRKTRPTIFKALDSLCSKGLIVKTEIPVAEHLKFCTYKAVLGSKEILPPVKKNEESSKEILLGQSKNFTGGGKETLPNNNTNNSSNNNIYIDIIEYLNQKAGTKYKATTPKTQTLIRTRLSEGFTFDDFKTVIDNKVSEWKGTEMQQYLRPETLFGTKFEGYLNTKPINRIAAQQANNKFHNFHQREDYDYDQLEKDLLKAQW